MALKYKNNIFKQVGFWKFQKYYIYTNKIMLFVCNFEVTTFSLYII